jgi:hypothetical protein
MGDAVVHRNDEIQIRYAPCGIGKIAKRLTELENATALIEYRLIDGSDIFFQADKRGVDVQHRDKRTQADPSIGVPLLPDQESPILGRPSRIRVSQFIESCAGARGSSKLSGIVSNSVPNASGRLIEAQCKSKSGRGLPLVTTRAARGYDRNIAAELNCIAKPLLAVQQDGLAGDIAVAKPKRLGKFMHPSEKFDCSAIARSKPSSASAR